MKQLNIFAGLRDFLILWGSQSVSTLGTAMTNFALIVWVYGQKGTASSITLLSVVRSYPQYCFASLRVQLPTDGTRNVSCWRQT